MHPAARLTHDQYFLSMLALVSRRSTCLRRDVGAIIISQDGVILATGYNGVPRGVTHCTVIACPGAEDERGDTRRCWAVHAEANALLQCQRLDLAHTMYVSCAPCFECSKLIANTRITRVVCLEDYPGDGAKMLTRAGVKIDIAKG